MITVLFELDDTLINNNAEQFTRIYLGLLGKHLQGVVDSKIMIPALLEGTNRMVEKTTLTGTLEETFDNTFYPAIKIEKSKLASIISDFYRDIFPILQPQTSPKFEAVELVKGCLEKGWQVAIATNPLFPMAAVKHRLNWAGLDKSEIPFVAITSFETYHFAKPQPAFFAEVRARIGANDHPVVMIGNDLNNDIIPAGQAGLPVFWLTDSEEKLPHGLPLESMQGEIDEVMPWLEKIEGNWRPGNLKPISAIMAALLGGAAAIDALVRDLDNESLNRKTQETDWNIIEIVCHLRDVDEEVNCPRIKTILNESKPFIAGIETDRWAIERNYKNQDGRKALKRFLVSRQEIIELLEKASEDTWQKSFRHTIFGPSTLKDLIEFILAHDNNHISQIKNLIH
jgi:FMN phosphatase YigB (HAD superfamily)